MGFTLNPLYVKYPDSGVVEEHTLEIETIRDGSLWDKKQPTISLTSLLVAISFAAAVILIALGGRSLLVASGVAGVVLIGGVVFGVWRLRGIEREAQARFARLTAPGAAQILPGEFVASQVQVDPHRPTTDSYTVIDYAFTTPEGRRLTGRQAIRALVNLPQPGTPVRVLYADDETFVML